MPARTPPPDGTVSRAEAAATLGVSPKRVTNMRWSGQLDPVTTPRRSLGPFDRAQVEALAAERQAQLAARQLEAERRGADPTPRLPGPPPDQDATFEELELAAEWTRDNPGPFVDTEGAAEILGVTAQYVGRLAAHGRLPWLPTGRTGGQPTGCTGERRIEVIARARRQPQPDC